MKITIGITPKEIKELLQAIGSSKEQIKLKVVVGIKDDKFIFREIHILERISLRTLLFAFKAA